MRLRKGGASLQFIETLGFIKLAVEGLVLSLVYVGVV